MADKINFLPLLGLGYFLTAQQQGKNNYRNDQVKYKTYDSGIYNIRFEYPASWVSNNNYSERYEGIDGFFQVADIQGIGRTIDEIVSQEIETPLKPYGKEPQIETFELGGEPARLIIPSSDQAKLFGREAALIVKNKRPVTEGQEKYNYTIIWSDLKDIGHIIKTFKFV